MRVFIYIVVGVLSLTIGLLITAVVMCFSAEAATLAPISTSASTPTFTPTFTPLFNHLPLVATQLPFGAALQGGQATVGQNGSVMSIYQSTPSAVLNWNSFNIGSAATVNVIQPSSSSVLLNTIIGTSPTQIYGHLSSNGQVYLTNPNGIYFAPGASVNVGGLMASTNTISTADFMAGVRTFISSGVSGEIINEGNITATLGGYIALLAPTVRNNGVIVAKMGTVVLAGGDQYVLQFSGNSLTNINVSQATVATLVENGNAVYAPGGLIILSAQGAHQIQSGIVGNSGVLDATGVTSSGGVIRLSATQTINAGGIIKANAAPNTDLNAGDISVISDLTNPSSQTNVTGFVSAQGGSFGGNGGTIETSGSTLLVSPTAAINTLAPYGRTGTWTIDPTNFTIDSVANGGDITATTLDLNLATSNVLITSSTGKAGTLGNIQVNQSVNWIAATSLTLNAVNNVVVSQSITENTVGSKIILVAGNDIDINAPINAVAAASGISMSAGNNVNINSPVTLTGVGANLAISAKNNILTTALISSVAGAASQVTLGAQNNTVLGGGINLVGVGAQVNITSGLDTFINSPLLTTGAGSGINVSATRDISSSGAGVVTATGASVGVNLTAGRNLSVGAAVSTVGATSPVELYSGLAGTAPGLASGTVFLNAAATGTSVSILFNPDGYANTAADIALYPVGANAKALVYLTGINKIYDATTTAAPLTFLGNPTLGGSVSLVTGSAAFISANAGTAVPINFSGYSLGGAGASLFSLMPNLNTTSANISPRPLAVSAVGINKTYDGTALASVILLGIPLSGDIVNLTAGPSTFASTNVGSAITINVTGITESGASAANYSVSPSAVTTASILQAPLTVTASNLSKSYGQTVVPTQFTSYGLMNGETIGGVTLISSGSAPSAGVALSPYTITPSSAVGGTFKTSNYNTIYSNGLLYVLPIGLLITVADVWKPFGSEFTPTAFSVSGLVNADTIGAVSMTSPGDLASATVAGNPYVITANPVSGGTFIPSNYTVQYVNGTLTVKPINP